MLKHQHREETDSHFLRTTISTVKWPRKHICGACSYLIKCYQNVIPVIQVILCTSAFASQTPKPVEQMLMFRQQHLIRFRIFLRAIRQTLLLSVHSATDSADLMSQIAFLDVAAGEA
jgi:hypothetical protein